jgi:hypothetical protein
MVRFQLILCFIFSAFLSLSQTNPSLHDLSVSDYSFTEWAANSPAQTYPSNMMFWTGPQDASLASNASGNYTGTYNATSASRINGLGNDGFSFVITGTEGQGRPLCAVLGINASNRGNILVSWTGGTVEQGSGNPPREHRFRLQYRIASGSWTDVPGPIEYSSFEKSPGHFETFESVVLPASCNDQSELYLRWIYYQHAQNGGGSRARLRVDDITVSSSAFLNAVYTFQDVVSASNVPSNVNASNVSVSTGSIAFQNGTDDGGTRIGNSASWPTGNFSTTGKHAEFSITPEDGYQIEYSALSFRFGRTTAGPNRVTVQYSLDGFATAGTTILNNIEVTSTDVNNLNAFSIAAANLPSGPQGGVLTIRVWGHNASGSGNLRFNNFRVAGVVTPFDIPVITPVFLSGAPFAMSNCSSTATGSIQYTVSSNFNTGNVFTVELSDKNGAFSTPLAIGSSSVTGGGTINFTLPDNLPSGNNYRIRILGSAPFVEGIPSTSFTITQNGENCPWYGDYQSKSSGNWADNIRWQKYTYNVGSKTKSWLDCASGDVPNSASASAYIRNSHQIILNTTSTSLNNLIIDVGGKLYRNSSSSTNFRYLNISGNIICNGVIGNGTTSDAIGFNIQEGEHTITGQGAFNCWRIRLSDEEINGSVRGSGTLIIDMDINLRWPATDGGKNAIYSNRSANTTFDVVINPGKTLRVTDANASIGMDGANNSPNVYPGTNRGGGYTVYGTIDCAGSYMLGSNNSDGFKPYMAIKSGGLLRVGFLDFGDNNIALGGTFVMEENAKLEITGGDVANNTWANHTVGTIGFNVADNTEVEYLRNGNQNVVELFDYFDLTFSGSGQKLFTGVAKSLVVKNNFTLLDDAEFNLNTNTIYVGGSWHCSSLPLFSHQTGRVVFTSGISSSRSMTGETEFYNILIDTETETIALDGTCYVTNLINLSSGNFNVDSGEMILINNDIQKGRVGEYGSGLLTGNFTWQNYVDRCNGWSLMASPLNTTLADFASNTDSRMIYTGFSGSNFPSFPFINTYFYSENSGYLAPTSVSNGLNRGSAIWYWNSDEVFNSSQAAIPQVWTNQVKSGIDFSETFQFNISNATDGFNLVGNPYPGTIDWESTGFTRTNTANAVYVFNACSQNYSSYVGGVGVNGGSRYLASGQGFYVEALGNGAALLATPKILTDNYVTLNKTNEKDALFITLNNDEIAIVINDNASQFFDSEHDAKLILSDNTSIYTELNSVQYAINAIEFPHTDLEIPLYTKGAGVLYFNNTQNIEDADVFLHDLTNNEYLDVKRLESHTFTAHNNEFSHRFNVVFRKKNSTLSVINNVGNEIGMYPNPIKSGDELTVVIPNKSSKILNLEMVDVLGKVVYMQEKFEAHESQIIKLNTKGLGAGTYILKISCLETKFSTKIIIH